jgi:hypothetical protein
VHFQPPVLASREVHEPLVCIERDLVLRIALVVRPGEHDFAGAREAAQVVDVTAGFVVDDPFAEPDLRC